MLQAYDIGDGTLNLNPINPVNPKPDRPLGLTPVGWVPPAPPPVTVDILQLLQRGGGGTQPMGIWTKAGGWVLQAPEPLSLLGRDTLPKNQQTYGWLSKLRSLFGYPKY